MNLTSINSSTITGDTATTTSSSTTVCKLKLAPFYIMTSILTHIFLHSYPISDCIWHSSTPLLIIRCYIWDHYRLQRLYENRGANIGDNVNGFERSSSAHSWSTATRCPSCTNGWRRYRLGDVITSLGGMKMMMTCAWTPYTTSVPTVLLSK